MARRDLRRKAKATKPRRHETLESRIVMSADPLPMLGLHGLFDDQPVMTTHGAGPQMSRVIVESAPARDPQADFWYDSGASLGAGGGLGERVQQTLFEANAMTGQGQVLSNYGFTGRGQTVAVIDTGIAYGHYALGGGVGAGYRVVGGWDFTENDANFYDDGPEGGHGTHVAGIVGARGDGQHSGVATGVDLVGLRVFDDAGNGYFSWVEQALRWVHTNRNTFANPITAINLSLGTEWNSNNNPSWANLEDEFATLVADGIFISVSAGNSFTNFNAKGVSYPASSDHVVPVMSLDPDGALSYYSQRAEYALAAPGRYITSTAPDYSGNDADTIDDDWVSMSGTSMAAPYVAGASTLVREAMQFVGRTGIDQWDIYNHLMSTADTFYDATTATNYKKLNLWTAINTLMPTDDYGSTTQTAHNLGTLIDSGAGPHGTVNGVISTLTDGDYFRFTAGASGRVTIAANSTTHQLVESWQAWGGTWSTNANGDCVIDVVAGQTYTFAITTSGGLGYYGLSFSLQSTFAPVEGGTLTNQQTLTGLSVNGDSWRRVTVGRTGYVTAEVLGVSGSASVSIYNAQQNLVAAAGQRADYLATAGQELFIRVTGAASSYSLRTTNAVTLSGAVVTAIGTAGNDAMSFTAGASLHTVSLNGVAYTFSASTFNEFRLAGGAGTDSFSMTGSAGADSAIIWGTNSQLTGSGYYATTNSFETQNFNGGGGADTARLYDSAGSDTYFVGTGQVAMVGAGYVNIAASYETTFGYSTSGVDYANFYDSANAEVYYSYQDQSILTGQGFSHLAHGFGNRSAYASNQNDVALIYDTAGNDTYEAYSDRVTMSGAGYTSRAFGFGTTQAFTSTGYDTATVYDTAGNDILHAGSNLIDMAGARYKNVMWGFDLGNIYATAGFDIAVMFDSAGNDIYNAYSDRVVMQGTGFENRAWAFDESYAFSLAGGQDTANFHGSAGADTFRAYLGRSTMSGTGYSNTVNNFRTVNANGSGPSDIAWFYDSISNDAFAASGNTASVGWGQGPTARAIGFGNVRTVGGAAGQDTLNVAAVDFAFSQVGVWV